MDNNKINQISDKVSRGALSKTAGDFLNEHLDRLSQLVDAKIFKRIHDGDELTYGQLIEAYAEKNAYNNIKRTLLQVAKAGVTSGDEFKKLLEKSNGKQRSARTFSSYRG